MQQERMARIEVDGKVYYPSLPTYRASLYLDVKNEARQDFYAFDSSNNLCGICSKIQSSDPSVYCIAPEQLSKVQEEVANGRRAEKVKFGFSVKSDNSHKGVFVFNSEEGSLADKCGLRMGDTILEVDDTRVKDISEFAAMLGYTLSPSGVTFGVLRDDKFILVDGCKE